MYAFLEILVRFSLLELTGKYLTQIKEHPGIPVVKIGHLHLMSICVLSSISTRTSRIPSLSS